MVRFKRLIAFWFLCAQVLFVSVVGIGVAAQDDLHVATAHQLALDHHHHDDFSSHFDHDDGAGAHVHVVDSFQPFGLIQENTADLKPFGSQTRQFLSLVCPPDIFLEGLLRPPQLLL
jgi:hypothetical protein